MTSIPKKIHYVWLGEKDFGPKEKYCVSTWSKLLPDYEIIRWDNDAVKDFDNVYFKQAMEVKQYAFASDYVRLKALEEHGGIYLDTDEEILKPLDCFLEHDYFMGCQSCGEARGLNPALIGAIPHHPIIKDLLELYDTLRFIKEDGSFNLIPNPGYFAKVLTEKYNIPTIYLKKGRIEFHPNCFLYDYFYFGKKNKTSYATHHYAGSWRPAWRVDDKLKFRLFGKSYVLRKYKKLHEEDMPIAENETMVGKIKTSKRSSYVLIRVNKAA